MTRYSLDQIKVKVNELASKIDAPSNILPAFGEMTYDAHPYIDLDMSGTMYYVISERGNEFVRKKTYVLDDLLYWVFENITSQMSSDYELNNRIEDKDGRRISFKKQEYLLGELNISWKEAKEKEHANILLAFPYDDLAGLRATFITQLRKQGVSEDEIYKVAYQRYPRN